MSRPTKEDKQILKQAKQDGCKPVWCDGILGWRYHCSCKDNEHGCDSQCSAILKGDKK